MDFRTRVWQQSRKNHQWSQLNIIWMKTEMNMHIHTWSPSWRNGNCSKRPSRSCGSSRIALRRIANVRSIKSVTTCWLHVLWWIPPAAVDSVSRKTQNLLQVLAKAVLAIVWFLARLLFLGDFFCIRLQLSPFNWCCSKFFETVSQRGYNSTSKSNAQKTNII